MSQELLVVGDAPAAPSVPNVATAGGSGIRKSAILLLSLEPQQAREILSRLPSDAVRAVRNEMASLPGVASSERSEVVEAYRRAVTPGPGPVFGVPNDTQADPLWECSPQTIFHALCDEHPQCIAAALASLPVEKAGQCLGRLPMRTQIEVIRRLASLRSIDPGLLQDLYASVRDRAKQKQNLRADAPCQSARVLDEPQGHRDEPIAYDAATSPGNVEDLLRLDERGMRLVLKEIDDGALGLAISTVSKRLRRRVLGLLSNAVADEVRRAAAARPLYLSDIESAQAKILRIVHRLESAGEVALTADPAARKGA